MIDLKPYYQVKLTLLRCKTYFLNNLPKTEDEKYACDIIQKAYWINEKKIEMLDCKLLEKYNKYLNSYKNNITRSTIMTESKYSDLIAKIQKKRKWIIGLTIAAVLLVLLFTAPIQLEIMGETIIDYKGLNPILIVVLVLLCFFAELIAYAVVSLPLNTSMDQECDPEKQLILNMNLNKQKNIDHIYAVDYLYLGNYQEALKYAEKMIQSSNEQMVLAGLFNQARCEFFLGNYDSFRQTVAQYESKLSSCQKLKPKTKIAYQKINNILNLMCAISDNDIEKINELRNNVEIWNTSKATEGFVNYIRGVAAYKVDDKEEAIYRFKLVKENCSKTVLSGLSEEYLSLLR